MQYTPAISISFNSSTAAGSVSPFPSKKVALMCLSRAGRWKGREGSRAILLRARKPCFKHPINRAVECENSVGRE